MKKFNKKESLESVPTPSSNILIESIRNLTNFLFTNVDVKFHGLENLQNINSPIIFAVAPHKGHMDSLFARRIIGKANKKIQKKSVFIAAGDGYWDKQPRKALGLAAVRTFTISRKGGEETQRNIQQVEQVIRQGNNLVVFPEGSRYGGKFKTGAAQWAINTRDLNTVIVPIHLKGAEQMMPPGASKPKRRNEKGELFSVDVTIVTPIRVADLVPHNFELISSKRQYTIIKQITAQIEAYIDAIDNFDHRGETPFQPY